MSALKLYVDTNAIKYNLEQIQKKVGKDVLVMPVIKAKAYGAGFETITEHIKNFPFIGVTDVSEADKIKEIAPDANVFILYQPSLQDIPQIINKNLTIAVSEIDFLVSLNKAAETKIDVHVSLDTGLGVSGVRKDDLSKFCQIVGSLENIWVKGAFTQLSTHESLEESDMAYTQTQVDEFKQAVEILGQTFGVLLKHINCSVAILTRPQDNLDMVRIGALVHGIYPQGGRFKDLIDLKPVMRLASIITSIRKLKKGSALGYGRSVILERDSIVATVNAGYSNGIAKVFGRNGGHVVVNKQCAPVIGNLCMNITTIDITDIKGKISIGDEVQIFDNDIIKLEQTSNWCNKGWNEFLTGLAGVQRI